MDTHCLYFVQRKKRYCRMTVKPGENYCGEHKPTITDKDDINEHIDDISQTRIVCPLDKTHTCYKSKLQKHLKKCNVIKVASQPYIVKNCNAEPTCEEDKRLLSNFSTTEIMEVICKVKEIFEKFVKNNIKSVNVSHDFLKNEIENPEYGSTTRKHLLQTSAIIEILHKNNLIQPETCFIEYGAGKGKLSFWLAKYVENIPRTSVLIVERASLRHKLDNKLEKNKTNVQRIRADIADLVLSKVEVVRESKQVVAVTKHLCGEATDLALKCSLTTKEEKNVQGILMSFCCHHRCHWNNYVGKDFFQSMLLQKKDFDIMCGLVSWAVCGTGKSREKRKLNETENNFTKEEKLQIDIEEKEEIGRKCKNIIDWGRKAYLEKNGFSSNLYYYVDSSVTLENVCIVAINQN